MAIFHSHVKLPEGNGVHVSGSPNYPGLVEQLALILAQHGSSLRFFMVLMRLHHGKFHRPCLIWLVVWNIFYFPIYLECHHPN